MAGKIKTKLAAQIVNMLKDKGAVEFDPNIIKSQPNGGSLACDWAVWHCLVPTEYGIKIEVFGWDTMTECVKHGIHCKNVKGFYDVYAKVKDSNEE